MPFKLSMTTFQISIMTITPAMASHKARHPSCNFSVFMTKAGEILPFSLFDLRCAKQLRLNMPKITQASRCIYYWNVYWTSRSGRGDNPNRCIL